MIRRSIFLLIVTVLFALSAGSALAQDKMLSVDTIFDPATKVNFNGSAPAGLQWTPDGNFYLLPKLIDRAKRKFDLMKVNAATGESTAFFDAAKMEASLVKATGITAEIAATLSHQPGYTFDAAMNAVLLNVNDDLYLYDISSDTASRLTNNADEEMEEDFSPDGKWASFVRKQNLFVVELRSGKETALTNDVNDNFLNGILDWVYEEELYGRGNKRGYWWSPDSKYLTYLRTDESPVKKFPVVDHIPREQKLEDSPYPLAGDPNPIVKLGVASVAGGATKWVDTAKYKPEDMLVVRVTWAPDSKRIVFHIQNREQTWLDLNAASPTDGKPTTLFTEKTQAWVEAGDNWNWLKDGSLLWRSERNGYMHIYHYSAEGKLLKQITDGKWEVRDIDVVDEANGFIYFSGSEHSPIAEHGYRIKLDGTGLTRLTQTEGNHNINFNGAATMFIDSWSDINTPTQVRLYKADGSLARVIAENKVEALAQYKLGKPEFMQVKTRDGFEMEAVMIKPPDFDPTKKYPVLSFTYSGPHSQTVRNSWGRDVYMWHQMLAQKGYIIWVCDNRSASGKGAVSTWTAYKNLGEGELRDLEDGVGYLKSLPYVDGSRIGIWGWSYGGFMTSYALTHSNLFKVGIAGGTVSDWANYDSIYTERYMLTPANNPEGYKKTSVTLAAKNMNSKLLLIHGAIDDNVHMANTIQFMYALQQANKQFQFMPYPKQRHPVVDPLLVRQMRQMMTDFVLANL
ncbi:MAG: S9 family peptidase [Pyrinomonadaceae bacterium]